MDFEDAILREACLEGAVLREAYLEGANLYEANLKEAKLWETDFSEADLESVILIEQTFALLLSLKHAGTIRSYQIYGSTMRQTSVLCPRMNKLPEILNSTINRIYQFQILMRWMTLTFGKWQRGSMAGWRVFSRTMQCHDRHEPGISNDRKLNDTAIGQQPFQRSRQMERTHQMRT